MATDQAHQNGLIVEGIHHDYRKASVIREYRNSISMMLALILRPGDVDIWPETWVGDDSSEEGGPTYLLGRYPSWNQRCGRRMNGTTANKITRAIHNIFSSYFIIWSTMRSRVAVGIHELIRSADPNLANECFLTGRYLPHAGQPRSARK
jgi:hypothetical protein